MSQNATKTLGKRIKSLRLAKEWTQADLAEALGCEPMTISRYERGSYAPGIEALEEMARALGCSMESFFVTAPPPAASSQPEPSSEELRHSLCDMAYQTDDINALKEIVASAKKILARHKKHLP
ncbi:helix-turn-helix transcriptional regulator [Pseudomonas lopnurensis]|nr:helix-turn-helix transcriptional regulator [Pseudomonas lopnurensis]MBE7374576.1 helix-turn-helix transcriptional regulator [Pseudomonas lopnurensis]